MKRSRKAFALGLVAPLLVVSGCSGGDPQPKIAPSVGTPSASNSPGLAEADEPPLPGQAQTDNDAGARAFVGYWIDLVNYAQATGDVSTLKSVNDVRCSACRGILKAISEPYDSGGRITGGRWEVGKLRKLPLDYGADWAAYAKARSAPQYIVDGDGTKKHFAGGPFQFYAYVAWQDSAWRMRWLRTPY